MDHSWLCGVARNTLFKLNMMFPPFASCYAAVDGAQAMRQHQQNKLRLLTFWRDAAERRLAALNAAITTLEQQIARDQPHQGS
jgi:hypothetical protein